MNDFVKYSIHNAIIDGDPLLDGTPVEVRLFGHVVDGPTPQSARFFVLEDWSGPRAVDWKEVPTNEPKDNAA